MGFSDAPFQSFPSYRIEKRKVKEHLENISQMQLTNPRKMQYWPTNTYNGFFSYPHTESFEILHPKSLAFRTSASSAPPTESHVCRQKRISSGTHSKIVGDMIRDKCGRDLVFAAVGTAQLCGENIG